MLFLFLFLCCIVFVTECVLSSEFLVLVLMVCYFVNDLVNQKCPCSLFHVRVLCFSFDFLEQKQDQGQTTKPIQTNNNIFSKNKGQRTNSKYKEQYQHQKKKHTFKEQNKKQKTRRIIKTHLMLFQLFILFVLYSLSPNVFFALSSWLVR